MSRADPFRKTPPASAFKSLSQQNAGYIKNVLASRPAEPLSGAAGRTQAAVAIILYESNKLWDGGKRGSSSSLDLGEPMLQVVMTTRALHLRSHPGQSSLPGGKIDRSDSCIEEAALRESEEEIGLDRKLLGKKVFWLQTREPFISKTCLLVHPVIFLLTDPASVLPQLVPCPTEVSSMWSFPMQLFLRSTLPPNMELPLSEPETIDTHREPQEAFRTYSDVPWLNSQHYRLHRFRTHRQLIKGLTADILIDAAQIVYGQPARYQLYAPDQPPWREWAQHILQQEKGKRLSRWGRCRDSPA